ncbi:hypothetical protein BJ508DRAFT_300565 [Ascobolus immersus RN42]|uniref:F-box domain-containing protein n=1 Tax=Ascobolus immersus RN42 TaxID=1160509 RepID=A0A3N4IR63_ASCIM|nr:hypothetical protein BJ508DRAFT_300565 [Ascobolus immersus RN42]
MDRSAKRLRTTWQTTTDESLPPTLPTTVTSIDNLPNELLGEIILQIACQGKPSLKTLFRLARTNKRFYAFINAPSTRSAFVNHWFDIHIRLKWNPGTQTGCTHQKALGSVLVSLFSFLRAVCSKRAFRYHKHRYVLSRDEYDKERLRCNIESPKCHEDEMVKGTGAATGSSKACILLYVFHSYSSGSSSSDLFFLPKADLRFYSDLKALREQRPVQLTEHQACRSANDLELEDVLLASPLIEVWERCRLRSVAPSDVRIVSAGGKFRRIFAKVPLNGDY